MRALNEHKHINIHTYTRTRMHTGGPCEAVPPHSTCRSIDDLHIHSWLWDKKPATLAAAAELQQLQRFDPEKGLNCIQYCHLELKCPDKAESINAANEIIYQGTIDGKKALRMRPESGADRSIVHHRMIPTSALSGKKGFFKSFNVQLDLAKVTIENAGEQCTVEVAVPDNLQYDALLGMWTSLTCSNHFNKKPQRASWLSVLVPS